MKEPTKLPFSYVGVYKLGEFRKGFVTFESFYRNHAVEFTDMDAAWLFWYLNENHEPGMPRSF